MKRITKQSRRLKIVATHSLNGLLLPIFNVLVSLLVIRLASVAVWGAFVQVLLVVQLGTHIVYWGNKEYLLRAFSRRPGELAALWQTAVFTRWPLYLLFMAVMALWGWPLSWLLLIWVWGAGLVVAQSVEVLVLYRRAFLFALAVELGTVILLLAGVLLRGQALSVTGLLLLFTLTQVGKAAVFFLYFRADVLRSLRGRHDPAYLTLAFPFLLLGLSGLLQSRIDLYSVSYFMNATEVGQYQVLTGFLLYIQALANFILLPFVKTVYRLETAVIHKISWRLFGLGLILVPPAIVLIGWLLRHLYQFDLSPLLLIVGGLYALPIFFTLPIIYALYKADRQRQVLYVNLVNTGLNLGLNILWIPRWGLLGALLATTLTSWLTLLFYWYRGRQLLKTENGKLETKN
jgi:O-antigen/teichoic acid export membrane protein